MALIDKVDAKFGFFQHIFGKIGGKAKNLVASTKLFMYNRLSECFTTNNLLTGYSRELFELLKFNGQPSERTLYRNITRLEKKHQFILEQY